ncbi:MAG: hypothetical protein GX569_13615 [Candidatus Riflebacteria bacterium]|nr:hypothetical protein [Candidatus Riflebacteria bacterium]
MKKSHGRCVVLVILMLLAASQVMAQVPALAEEYMRNGEIYLLISYKDVPIGDHAGVHRLSDPANAGLYVGRLYDPGSSIGICVDLNRVIYTFTEDKSATVYQFLPNMKLLRQVVDESCYAGDLVRAQCIVDYGYHQYFHADHRPANPAGVREQVYRVGPVGRYVRGSGQAYGTRSGWPGAGTSNHSALYTKPINAQMPCCQLYTHLPSPTVAGCGTPTDPPAAGVNPLPKINNIQDPMFPGKQWYLVPNGAWYSTWQSKPTQSGAYGPHPDRIFYQVFRDYVTGRPRYWKLTTWDSNTKSIGAPANIGPVVGTTYDVQIARKILAGCLDGCGGATGSGSGTANPMWVSVAFQPPIGGGQSRTYLYSRERPLPNYNLTLSKGGGAATDYNPPADNPLIGSPYDMGATQEKGTRWVGISLRDANTDYVYTLGTSLINSWYEEATPGTGDFSIDAVTVSNQWDQNGGIVYAYDKNLGLVLKFVRNEKTRSVVQFEPIPVGNNVDAIAADGFGSLYFSKTVADPVTASLLTTFEANPNSYIERVRTLVTDDGSNEGVAFFEQRYSKTVFERNVYTGQIETAGNYHLGSNFRARRYVLPPDIVIDTNPTGFEARLIAAGGWWAGWLSSLPTSDMLNDGAPPVITYDPNDSPDHIELSVINVPTPPMPHRFEDGSRVDIVGAFQNYPVPSTDSNNQGGALAPGTILDNRRAYFFMPENYPLDSGKLNPTEQPDWNANGYLAGFVNTLDKVRYTWKLWTVSQPTVNHPENLPEVFVNADPVVETTSEPYFVFYSPIGGKYVLTLEAKFDWYDFTKLPFGGMRDDVYSPTGIYRSTVYKTDEKAVARSREATIENIKSAFSGSLIMPELSARLDTIVPPGSDGKCFVAAIPINVATSAPVIGTDTLKARIERCDDMTIAENLRIWAAHNLSNGYHHGVNAGPASYGWRIEDKYLKHMFFDISTSNLTSNENDSKYNYVADRITTSGDPLYVRSDPLLRFENNPGDLRWDGDVILTGVMELALPSGQQTVRLFGNDSNPEIQVTDKKQAFGVAPIAYPSDPKFHRLMITARRNFRYKVYPIAIITHPVTGVESEMPLSPIWLTNVMSIEAEAFILGVDKEAPLLQAAQTNPCNIFGLTGQPLTANVGPSGYANPEAIYWQLSDNSPWENSSQTGVSAAISVANRSYNQAYDGKATYNLKPVFSKAIRKISLKYEFTENPNQYAVTRGTTVQELSGSGVFEGKNDPGSDNTINSHLGFTVPLESIGYGNIARNYANNTPGYVPYTFDIIATDSSGNILETKLNLVLNVRDNIPPIPWLTMQDRKTGESSIIPRIAGMSQQDYSLLPFKITDSFPAYKPTVATNSIAWNSTTEDGIVGGFTGETLLALPHISAGVLNPADSSNVDAMNKLIKQGVPPNFLEDNVEFLMFPFAADNAGGAVATVTVRYIDAANGNEATWSSGNGAIRDNSSLQPLIASGSPLVGFFRGLPGDFPMLAPVVVSAEDDARSWNWYVSPTGDKKWVWPANGSKPDFSNANPPVLANERTFSTMLLIYDSRMRVRTIDTRQQRD